MSYNCVHIQCNHCPSEFRAFQAFFLLMSSIMEMLISFANITTNLFHFVGLVLGRLEILVCSFKRLMRCTQHCNCLLQGEKQYNMHCSLQFKMKLWTIYEQYLSLCYRFQDVNVCVWLCLCDCWSFYLCIFRRPLLLC